MEGDWTCVKEFLRCKIYKKAGTVSLPKRKLQELTQLLSILVTQLRIVCKELECLVGKHCYMHLVVPGAVSHLYHIHSALSHGGEYRATYLHL